MSLPGKAETETGGWETLLSHGPAFSVEQLSCRDPETMPGCAGEADFTMLQSPGQKLGHRVTVIVHAAKSMVKQLGMLQGAAPQRQAGQGATSPTREPLCARQPADHTQQHSAC